MRIARFAVADGDPRFGVVTGEAGTEVLSVLDGDPLYRPPAPTGERLPLADVRLLAPVLPRSKVVSAGFNYAGHDGVVPGAAPQPLLAIKPNTTVVGPGDGIVLPAQSQDVWFEGELAVVIGRICRHVPADRFADVVFGYTCADDVTAVDLGRADGGWTRAKAFDTFCPLGPWIETQLEPADLAITTRVDGQLRQDGRTSQLRLSVPELVAAISAVTTLLPGDVVLTGTPAGAGPVAAGNRVAVTVEGIGTLQNPVVRRD